MSDHMTRASKRSQLLRTLERQGITDPAVLAAIERIPRERFVPREMLDAAYENRALAIDQGQTISQPYIVALMTQELKLSGVERVLEVGTGSGYQTAILSLLSRSVFTVERIAELSLQARSILDQIGIENVHFRTSDGSQGWPAEAPFDRIIVTATGPEIPHSLEQQLAEGGILIMPVGKSDHQSLIACHKRNGELYREFLCECRFVRLIGAQGWAEENF